MDEKTEELRDIFMDVAEDGTVTEEQTQGRGSLASSAADVDARLRGVVESMRERYDFATSLDDGAYCAVVRGFYDGEDDEAMAERVDDSVETVRRARLDLHLLRDDDAAGVDLGALREQRGTDVDDEAIATALDVDEDTLERAEEVLEAREEARRASQRYRSEFEEILTDADIAVRLTASVHEDGLDEAAEDIETDVEF